MSPARSSPPVRVPNFTGRAAPVSLPPQTVAYPWPTQATTGYVNAPGYPGSLTTFSGTITSNTTYNFREFSGGAEINANLVNVTFNGCLFTSSGGVGNSACDLTAGGNNGITFSYCTFAPTGITEPGPPGGVTLAQSYQFGINAGPTGALTAQYCDLWGFGNAIVVSGGDQAHQHIFRSNYIHDPCQSATYHTDGLGQPAGGTDSYVSIIGNSIVAWGGGTQALAYQNSPGPSTWSNFTVTGNLFGGYGYTVCIIGGTSGSPTGSNNITFTGNTYTTEFVPAFGPLYDNAFVTSPGSVWNSNKWLVPPGAQWGHSQYNGYFWIPGTISNASPSLDELAAGLVSPTDF
jgi:hypothetical protein